MISRVGPTFDIPRSNEPLRQLRGGLLGDSEMGREVGGGGVALGDTGEGETMQRSDVAETCARNLGLDRVDKAGREPENGGRRGPTVVRHRQAS